MNNSQEMKIVGSTIIHDDNILTGCLSISLKNKGTSTVVINENIPLEAGEYIVLPSIDGYYFSERLSVRFIGGGTKKLLIIKLIAQ